MSDYVLGLDPGLANCGYAVLRLAPGAKPVVVAMGVVSTKKDDAARNVAADNVRRGIEVAVALEHLMAGRRPDLPARAQTGRKLDALFDARPIVKAVCVESMSHPRSASAAAKMAVTWGIILANVVRRGMPLIHQSPQTVKMQLVGANDASKDHVAAVLRRRWGAGLKMLLAGVPRRLHEHAYDALAAATTGMTSPEGRQALAAVGIA